MCFSLCPLPLVLAQGTTKKKTDSIFSAPSLQISVHIDEISEHSLFQAEHSKLSQPFLIGKMDQFLNHLSDPSLDSLKQLHMLYW